MHITGLLYQLLLLTLVLAVGAVDDLSSVLTKLRAGNDVAPGISAAVMKVNSKTGTPTLLAQGAIGLRRLGSQEQLLPTDPMRIGSVSKSFTSTAIGMLVDAGKLKFTDKLGAVLKGVPMNAQYASATVQQLLQHRAGFPRDCFQEAKAKQLLENSTLSVPAIRELYARYGLSRRPAKALNSFLYSNCGYGVAGLVVDTLAGVPYEQYVTDKIFRPLGLTTARFGLQYKSPWQPKVDVPFGHECLSRKGQKAVEVMWDSEDRGEYYNAEGGIDISMPDLAKYTAWHLAGVKGLPTGTALLSQATFKQLHTPYGEARDKANGDYAMGWEEQPETSNVDYIFSHSGVTEGFNAETTADVTEYLVVSASTNYDTDSPVCLKGLDDAEALLSKLFDQLSDKYYDGSRRHLRMMLSAHRRRLGHAARVH